MQLLLNIFLVGFFLDSGISFVDELLKILTGIKFFSSTRIFISWCAILLSIPIYIASGINASIPKKYFFPLIFFLLWSIFTAQPLPLFFEEGSLNLVLSSLQLLISILIFTFIKLKSGSWLISDNSLPDFSFSIKNTLGFFTGNIIVLPAIILIAVFVSLQVLINHQTAGFLRLSTDGIYMKEKIYEKDNKEIKLIGMIHIGEDSYYKNLTESIPLASSILLAEGVSDKNNLIKHRFSTKGFAQTYGLSSQEEMDINGEYISHEQFISSDFSQNGSELYIIRADVDVSSFSRDTINFLNIAGEHIFREDSFATGINEYNKWLKTNYSPSFIANIKLDILEKRNEKVIGFLNTAIEKFSIVIVPWGAMHMPAIEKAVQEMGFSKVNTNERLSMEFNFSRLRKLLSSFPEN